MNNNLANFKDATTISTSCMFVFISTLKFKNKNLHHELIMAKKKIRELKTRIFVNKNVFEDIKLEKLELEKKVS